MGVMTDPGATTLIYVAVAAAVMAGAGYLLQDQIQGSAAVIVFFVLVGFLAGLYIMSHSGEWLAFLIPSAALVLLLGYVMGTEAVQVLAAYTIGYVVGIRTRRRR